MSNFPHSRLFLGGSRTVLVSGPHIQILKTETGEVLHSTVEFDGAAKDGILKSGHVRCAAVDISNVHLATSGDDKVLKVWKIDGLQHLSSRELPKKPTSVQFLRDGQTILVSDKFGDIFSYPLHPGPGVSNPSQSESSKRDSLTSHENPSGGTLVLGHASVLTSFVLSADERYVISADRDEHVRVSWYPQGWNVETFCLGHKKYVSSVHIPCFSPDILISGGGDPIIKIWDWMAGKVKAEVEVWSTVQRFIKVEGGRKGRGWGEETKGRYRRKSRSQTKGNQSEEEGEDAEESGGGVGPSTGNIAPDEPQANTAEPGEIVQVVHQINSFNLGTGKYIIFSAVGATAIFIFSLPELTISSLPPTSRFDFGRPVLDFVIGSEGLIWVLLDGEWDEAGTTGKMIRVVRWDSVAEEFEEIDESSGNVLLASLNSSCLLPAISEDLESLDLYAHLSTMSKNSSDDAEGAGGGTLQRSKNKNKDKVQPAATKRELGRLKNKQALAKVVEGSTARKQHDKDADEEGYKDGDERENKRPKSEGGSAQAEEACDVVMDEL